jgi:hypothetical protein
MKLRRDLTNTVDYKDMVHWFSPHVLLKTLEKVLPSTFFARYADRRLVHAALDSPLDEKTLIENRCGGAKGICGDEERPEIWVDYVADLGDGFDSTYAIAYSIGSKELRIGGDLVLPRADCLIMGGDEVYPDASREDYEARMQRPYRLAFPIDSKPGACHPPAFLIPGNHDWYDGLTLFLAKFCTGDSNLGSWRLPQTRSYFAFQLANNWWVWGFDSQLEENVDKPQADFFAAVAKKMDPEAKVIICASVPTWLGGGLAATDKAKQDRFYQGLEFVAEILYEHTVGAKVPLVLSGDLHHYSRYRSKESGTNFITAGGGGAFLHPTHFVLSDTINKVKWGRIEQTLEIGRDAADPNRKAIYPSHEESRGLATGNLLFWRTNWNFCVEVLGPLYLVCALLMLTWKGYGETGGAGGFLISAWDAVNVLWPTPIFLLIAFGIWLLFFKTSDMGSKRRRRFVATIHSLFHIGIVLFGTAIVSVVVNSIQSVPIFGDIFYFLAICLGMLIFGFLGGFIWGAYLTAASYFWGDEANNAFSAMRLDGYRHFLRLKIENNKITIFPIGIDKAPKRSDWKINPEFDEKNPDQNTPAVIPKKNLGQHLIEEPIVLDIDQIGRLRPT